MSTPDNQQADWPDAASEPSPDRRRGERKQEGAPGFAEELLEKLERLYFTAPLDETSVAVCDVIIEACDEIRQIIARRDEARERGTELAKVWADVSSSKPPVEKLSHDAESARGNGNKTL